MLKGPTSRYAVPEETISKLEGRSVGIMQSEEQREYGMKYKHRDSKKCEMPLSTPAYM